MIKGTWWGSSKFFFARTFGSPTHGGPGTFTESKILTLFPMGSGYPLFPMGEGHMAPRLKSQKMVVEAKTLDI